MSKKKVTEKRKQSTKSAPAQPDALEVARLKEQLQKELPQEKVYLDESDETSLDRRYYTHAEYYQLTKEKELAQLAQEIEEKESRDTKKKRQSWWIKTILMLVFIGVSVYIMFKITDLVSPKGTKSFLEMVQGIDWRFLLLFVGIILISMLFEGCTYSYLIKISTGKFHLKTSLKTMYLGKYYDGITPLATGGQPFQIYYLHKKDIPTGVATAVPLVRYIVTTFVFCFASVIMLALVPHVMSLDDKTYWLVVVAWVSLGLNLLVPVAIMFVSLFPKTGRKMIASIVSLLSKIRIVKHKYPTMKKYITEIDEYRDALKLLIRRWWKLIPLVIINLLYFVVYVSIPFFATLTIAGPSISDNLPLLFIQTACLSIVTFYSVSWIPTPGNSGVNEASAALVFTTLKNVDSITGWMVLLWRFAIYYVFILSGIGISIFEIIRSAVRNRRAAKAQKQEKENSTQTPQETPQESPPQEEEPKKDE